MNEDKSTHELMDERLANLWMLSNVSAPTSLLSINNPNINYGSVGGVGAGSGGGTMGMFLINASDSTMLDLDLSLEEPVVAASLSQKPWPFLKQPQPMIIILIVAYVVVFLLGVINNLLVICVIYRNRQLRTVTNFFIANLAVADVLVCVFVLPITLVSNIFMEWWYGPLICKAAPYLQGVAVGASVNTMASVAIERYLAIFYPTTRRLTPRNSCFMIAIIWIIPMCLFIPWIVVYAQLVYRIQGFSYIICTANWSSEQKRNLFTLFTLFLTCYIIPLIIISTFYLLIGIRVWNRKVRGLQGRAERSINRSKVRIVRMLVVVFVMFSVSWLPLYSIEFRLLFLSSAGDEEKVMLQRYLIPFAQWLGASNSCINPFIYVYFSANFRKSILAVIHSKSCCSKINV